MVNNPKKAVRIGLLATQVVLLGTGNPNPDPDRQGPALLILVDNRPYLFDFGPGIVRRAAALTRDYGGPLHGFRIEALDLAFLTHLHSDHTAGLPDLLLTPWVMGRNKPLKIYGPVGTARLSLHVYEAYKDDIVYRLEGSEPASENGWKIEAVEFEEGAIHQDSRVQVEAFSVSHGAWPNAFGFKIITSDKVVVLSGDTAPCGSLRRNAAGADILIHEVYSTAGLATKDKVWQEYHRSHHTSTEQLAQIASHCRPGLLVLSHILTWGVSEQDLLDEIRRGYTGEVMVGRDLQVFE